MSANINNMRENIKELELEDVDFKKYGFLEGLYKKKLQNSLLIPSATFLTAGLFGAVTGLPIVTMSGVAMSSIISFFMLKGYKGKFHWELGLVPNEKNKEFALQIGWEVIEHKETTLASMKTDNLVKPLLLTAETWSRHSIICGTTGSGKTVYLQFLGKQILNQGGGFMFVNGKPDLEMKKEIYALCAMVGREQDFYYLDFNNPSKSMSMAMFEMSTLSVLEYLKVLLGVKADGEWGQKADNLMSSLAGLWMTLKEFGLIFPHSECKNINTIDDLKAIKHTYPMGFYILDSYMVSKKIVDLLGVFSKLYKTNEGKEYFNELTKNKEVEFFKEKEIHYSLVSSMEKLTNLDYETLTTKSFEQIIKDGDDPFYSVGIAIDYWTPIMKKFSDDYGDILDSTTPQININDIVRGHKILYVSLPGTSSKTNIELLGKMIIAQIKAVYENIQNASPLEIPFTVFLDEFNSWSKGLIGFGDVISQTRSKRLAFSFLFQDSLKSMDEKGLEGGQIFANVNTKVILKVESLELIKEFIEHFGKVEKLEKTQQIQIRNASDNSDKGTFEQDLKTIEKDRLKIDQIVDLQPGQCFIKIGSKGFTSVGGYHEPIRYETSDSTGNLPMETAYNKTKAHLEIEDYLNKDELPKVS